MRAWAMSLHPQSRGRGKSKSHARRWAILSAAAAAAAVVIAPGSAVAAVSITPLSTFGGGDGWLAPGEGGYGFLGTSSNERGLAFGNGHLYLVSRSGGTSVRIL